jgi:alternate signal-mediated exported protein
MNSKLLKASLAGVAAIAVAAGGSTFASWSDFNDVNNNNVGAGVLKMTLDPNANNPGQDRTFDNLKLAPGQYFENQFYVATNDATSTPKARLFIDIRNIVGTENGCDTNSETAEDTNCAGPNQGDLIDQATLTAASYLPTASGSCNTSAQVLPIRSWKISELVGGTFPMSYLSTAPTELELTGEFQNTSSASVPGGNSGVINKKNLAPGEGLCVSLTVGLPNAANNNLAQGDDLSFDLRFEVRQDTFTYGSDVNYFTP